MKTGEKRWKIAWGCYNIIVSQTLQLIHRISLGADAVKRHTKVRQYTNFKYILICICFPMYFFKPIKRNARNSSNSIFAFMCWTISTMKAWNDKILMSPQESWALSRQDSSSSSEGYYVIFNLYLSLLSIPSLNLPHNFFLY